MTRSCKNGLLGVAITYNYGMGYPDASIIARATGGTYLSVYADTNSGMITMYSLPSWTTLFSAEVYPSENSIVELSLNESSWQVFLDSGLVASGTQTSVPNAGDWYAGSGQEMWFTNNDVTVVPPSISISAATNIGSTSATGNANITSDGGGTLTARGFCWGTSPNPTIGAGHYVSLGAGAAGAINGSITGLTASTGYYYRAYAQNSAGLTYSANQQFSTTSAATAPTVTTSAATSVGQSSATGNGNVTADGGAGITERGFCWSTSANPTTANSKIIVSGTTGSYSGSMTGLAAGTLYHYRAYATNSVGTSYGTDIQFTTSSVQNYTLTYTSAGNGSISGTTPQTVANGGSGTQVTAVPNTGYYFLIWSDSVGTAARTDTNVTADKSVIAYFYINSYTLTYNAGTGGTISGTTPQTVNHGSNGSQVTAVPNGGYIFVNWSDGVTTASRTDTSITANKTVTANFTAILTPTVTDSAATNITTSGATANGNITADGGATITERGFCYRTSANPTIVDSKIIISGTTGTFSGDIAGLTHSTFYYYRAYATNSAGTSYGTNIQFYTLTISSQTLVAANATGSSPSTITTSEPSGQILVVSSAIGNFPNAITTVEPTNSVLVISDAVVDALNGIITFEPSNQISSIAEAIGDSPNSISITTTTIQILIVTEANGNNPSTLLYITDTSIPIPVSDANIDIPTGYVSTTDTRAPPVISDAIADIPNQITYSTDTIVSLGISDSTVDNLSDISFRTDTNIVLSISEALSDASSEITYNTAPDTTSVLVIAEAISESSFGSVVTDTQKEISIAFANAETLNQIVYATDTVIENMIAEASANIADGITTTSPTLMALSVAESDSTCFSNFIVLTDTQESLVISEAAADILSGVIFKTDTITLISISDDTIGNTPNQFTYINDTVVILTISEANAESSLELIKTDTQIDLIISEAAGEIFPDILPLFDTSVLISPADSISEALSSLNSITLIDSLVLIPSTESYSFSADIDIITDTQTELVVAEALAESDSLGSVTDEFVTLSIADASADSLSDISILRDTEFILTASEGVAETIPVSVGFGTQINIEVAEASSEILSDLTTSSNTFVTLDTARGIASCPNGFIAATPTSKALVVSNAVGLSLIGFILKTKTMRIVPVAESISSALSDLFVSTWSETSISTPVSSAIGSLPQNIEENTGTGVSLPVSDAASEILYNWTVLHNGYVDVIVAEAIAENLTEIEVSTDTKSAFIPISNAAASNLKQINWITDTLANILSTEAIAAVYGSIKYTDDTLVQVLITESIADILANILALTPTFISLVVAKAIGGIPSGMPTEVITKLQILDISVSTQIPSTEIEVDTSLLPVLFVDTNIALLEISVDTRIKEIEIEVNTYIKERERGV